MPIGLELGLPDEEQRAWLLDGLARLIAQRGHKKFIDGPVLLPNDEYFPDPVEPGPRGARTLLRRLGSYVGLDDLGVRLRVYEQAEHLEFDRHGVGHGGSGAAAWFAGIQGGICEYGVERRELADPDELIGTLGHEVAHAYRHRHALVVPTRDVEEKLTDLTAVYLGFGVFLLNSSQSFKTGGYSASGERLLFERKSRGYLSPSQIAFLLGAQIVARATTPDECRSIGRALAPNHAKLFEDARRAFGDEVSDLARRLGIPPGASRSRNVPITPLSDDEREGAVIEVPAVERSVATRAFRVKRHRGLTYAVLGAGAPIVVAATGALHGSGLMVTVAAGAALGFVVGARARDDRCSSCSERLDSAVTTCPSCGAVVVGNVSSDEERLEAEEALEVREPEYDYFADPIVSEDEKAETRLIGAIYVDWLFKRGLIASSFRARSPELAERASRGELGTAELSNLAEEPVEDDAALAFKTAYFEDGERWSEDYALLTTANRIRDTRAGYQRVQALWDRRFDEWRASSGDA